MTTRLNPLVMIATIKSPTRYSDVRKGRGEEIEKVSRPHILEQSHRQLLHHARQEIPQEHCAEQRRHKVEVCMRDGIEVAGEKTPNQIFDRDEDKNREDALRAAAIEVEHAQHDGTDARGVHRPPPSACASCATLTNRSSRLAAPCCSGSVFGSPLEHNPPMRQNSTRSQTAWTSYMLWLVHNTPQSPLSTNFEMPARMSRAFEGIDGGGGLVEQKQPGEIEHGLGERESCLLAG